MVTLLSTTSPLWTYVMVGRGVPMAGHSNSRWLWRITMWPEDSSPPSKLGGTRTKGKRDREKEGNWILDRNIFMCYNVSLNKSLAHSCLEQLCSILIICRGHFLVKITFHMTMFIRMAWRLVNMINTARTRTQILLFWLTSMLHGSSDSTHTHPTLRYSRPGKK